MEQMESREYLLRVRTTHLQERGGSHREQQHTLNVAIIDYRFFRKTVICSTTRLVSTTTLSSLLLTATSPSLLIDLI